MQKIREALDTFNNDDDTGRLFCQPAIDLFATVARDLDLGDQVELARVLFELNDGETYGLTPDELMPRLSRMKKELRCNSAFGGWDKAALDRLELGVYHSVVEFF